MPIIRKLGKVGHSFCLTMPPEIRRHLSFNQGDYLVWTIDKEGRVVIEKLTPKKHPGFFVPGTGWLKRAK